MVNSCSFAFYVIASIFVSVGLILTFVSISGYVADVGDAKRNWMIGMIVSIIAFVVGLCYIIYYFNYCTADSSAALANE